MSENIGVIGLGNMGAGMASTLHKKGFSVIGYDLSEQARGRLQEKGVSCVDSCETLLKQVSIVILSLPKSEHVEAVCLKDGGIGTYGQPGLIVIDTTTSTPEVSRRVASCLKEKGIGFVDAPVSAAFSLLILQGFTIVAGHKLPARQAQITDHRRDLREVP